jgi:DNA-binding transcriptional ArsR family regulator
MKDSQTDKLIENDFFYQTVYRKSEKVSAAIITITRSENNKDITDPILKDVETAAQQLVRSVHELAVCPYFVREEFLATVRKQMLWCDLSVSLATAARFLTPEQSLVLRDALRGLLSDVRRYVTPSAAGRSLDALHTPGYVPGTTRSRPTAGRASGASAPAFRSAPAAPRPSTPSSPAATDRRGRIEAIVRDKGEVTIKDISDVITDVSEKTIQRELIDMIAEGVVLKTGERRWSRYRLSQTAGLTQNTPLSVSSPVARPSDMTETALSNT